METGLNASPCVGKQPITTEHPIGCKQQPIGCSIEAVLPTSTRLVFSEAVATMSGCLPTQAIAFWWKPGLSQIVSVCERSRPPINTADMTDATHSSSGRRNQRFSHGGSSWYISCSGSFGRRRYTWQQTYGLTWKLVSRRSHDANWPYAYVATILCRCLTQNWCFFVSNGFVYHELLHYVNHYRQWTV